MATLREHRASIFLLQRLLSKLVRNMNRYIISSIACAWNWIFSSNMALRTEKL